MKVLVAGRSGTIGVPLARALVTARHDVVATARSPEKLPSIRALGATPMIMDALEATAVNRVLQTASPEVVIHQLTALFRAGPKRARDLAATNRLRDEGTRHLLGAAIAAGARRFIGGSFAIVPPARPVRTDTPCAPRHSEGSLQAASCAETVPFETR